MTDHEEMIKAITKCQGYGMVQAEKIDKLEKSVSSIETTITKAFDGVNLQNMQKRVDVHSTRLAWLSGIGSIISVAGGAALVAHIRKMFD